MHHEGLRSMQIQATLRLIDHVDGQLDPQLLAYFIL